MRNKIYPDLSESERTRFYRQLHVPESVREEIIPKILNVGIDVLLQNGLDCAIPMAAVRWQGGNPVCPSCKTPGTKPYLAKRKVWVCARPRPRCRRQYSVKVATIFEDSHLTVRVWLSALWLIVNCERPPSPQLLSKRPLVNCERPPSPQLLSKRLIIKHEKALNVRQYLIASLRLGFVSRPTIPSWILRLKDIGADGDVTNGEDWQFQIRADRSAVSEYEVAMEQLIQRLAQKDIPVRYIANWLYALSIILHVRRSVLLDYLASQRRQCKLVETILPTVNCNIKGDVDVMIDENYRIDDAISFFDGISSIELWPSSKLNK